MLSKLVSPTRTSCPPSWRAHARAREHEPAGHERRVRVGVVGRARDLGRALVRVARAREREPDAVLVGVVPHDERHGRVRRGEGVDPLALPAPVDAHAPAVMTGDGIGQEEEKKKGLRALEPQRLSFGWARDTLTQCIMHVTPRGQAERAG